ncbi:hypothetical protein EMPS_04368 [Entomortierella parvispora]|uniref:C2 domain-containing protein n=1 Tax=Entomortierella parvispora TaxID=205924 RepID=A0A9P3LVC1_9FUNG|nr:hypothetical protein EMPS_04368 [Entomortierella parvispora]
MFHRHHDGSLEVTIHSAHGLDDVERFGKNDAYTRISLDFKHDKSFEKTFVHKNGGENPVWNQTLTLKDLKPEYHDLYLEILDDETTVDAPIAFAAIPLNQVFESPNNTFSGKFDVYTPSGKTKGEINLTIRALQPDESAQGQVSYDGSDRKGISRIDEAHQKRVKSLKNKETAADVGGVALAGLAALGAGYLLTKQDSSEKDKKEAEEKLRNEAREFA